MDKQRLIYISLFVLATIGLGFALYFVFFAPEKSTPTGPGAVSPGEPGAFPTASTGTRPVVTPTDTTLPDTPTTPTTQPGGSETETTQPPSRQLVNTPVVGVSTDATGAAKFYNENDGKFYQIGRDGSVRQLSEQVFYNVQNVTWSPSQNESIIEYPDGSNIYYNFDTKKQVTLPQHWEGFSFSSQGDKIAAKSIGLSPDSRWLVSADPQGKSVTLIEPLGDNADKVIVDWSPNNQIVALSRTGESMGAYTQQLLFVGLNGENFPGTVVEGRDLRTKWSNTGSTLLYSVFSPRTDYKPELWVASGAMESLGSGRKVLSVNTWADKCSFSDDRFVFCGVPEALETGAGFQPGLADTAKDILYKIDTVTGLKTEIPLDAYHTINTITISPDGKTLYFTDKNRDGLFQVAI